MLDKFLIVLSCAVIALGITGAALTAVRLVRGQTGGHPMTPGERHSAWQSVLSSGLLVVTALCQLMTQLTAGKAWQRAELGAAIVLILYTVTTWLTGRGEDEPEKAAARPPDPGVPAEWPRGPELPHPTAGASARQLAEWVHRKRFFTTRLQSGYDEEEVDLLLGTIRDTFLGTRPVPVTRQEVTGARFTRTHHLRPGYREEEVNTFLAWVGARLE